MMKNLMMLCGLLVLLSSSSIALDKVEPLPAPDWARDLVIYEIATKGYTSPAGPESGTFNSLSEKIPYLADLGINAIWLTGHSLSDSSHFYGIWTQYANVEPDKLDPSLGSLAEFKAMVKNAHDHGIRIFLDTIEHGVMNYSPLIKEQPHWFKGGSWGMTDYDWEGDHPDLEEWWINIWTTVVLDWGVDGFRCDMGLHRPDLWEEIKRRCAEAGKPIFVLGESGRETISHASQRDIMLYDIREGLEKEHAALTHLAGMEDLQPGVFTGATARFICEIKRGEELQVITSGDKSGPSIRFIGWGEDVVGRWEVEPEGDLDWSWKLSGVDPNLPFDHMRIYAPDRSWHWQTEGSGWKLHIATEDDGYLIHGGDPLPGKKMRVIAPSCHDCGWDGYPLGENSYSVQGSRHIMGYGTLLAPAIPLFMSGEEFGAEYRPLPRHTPGLFGKGEPGTGRWLYASWIDWDQLAAPEGQAMFKDVQRLLQIRRDHGDLFRAMEAENDELKISAANVVKGADLPVPYILKNGEKAILVAGNPTSEFRSMTIRLNTSDLGLDKSERKVRVTKLWPMEEEAKVIKTRRLRKFKLELSPDKQPGGGLQVFLFENLD